MLITDRVQAVGKTLPDAYKPTQHQALLLVCIAKKKKEGKKGPLRVLLMEAQQINAKYSPDSHRRARIRVTASRWSFWSLSEGFFNKPATINRATHCVCVCLCVCVDPK